MKTLVISAVNFTEGGPLTVLRDCVAAAVTTLPGWRIIVMAHDAALIDIQGVEVMAFPKTKSSWLRRLALEWQGFGHLSESLRVDLWLSLHDITPRVKARRQVVYCHNPAPFSRATWRDSWFEPKFLAFSLLYGRMYAALIQRNYAVVVQQDWLRKEFKRRYGVSNVIVAHPESGVSKQMTAQSAYSLRTAKDCVFFFPSLPRCFKNFEVIGQALEILERSESWSGSVRWTIDGTENRYARWLRCRFGKLRSLHWIGHQSRAQMLAQYAQADCLVFPSRAETWGLPISEAKQAQLSLLVADLPYAHETVGSWDRVAFFPPHDPQILAQQMAAVVNGFDPFKRVQGSLIEAPNAAGWSELLTMLTHDL